MALKDTPYTIETMWQYLVAKLKLATRSSSTQDNIMEAAVVDVLVTFRDEEGEIIEQVHQEWRLEKTK